LFYLISSPI